MTEQEKPGFFAVSGDPGVWVAFVVGIVFLVLSISVNRLFVIGALGAVGVANALNSTTSGPLPAAT